MAAVTLLLADNDQEFLETRKVALEKAGFEVLLATTPAEARRVLLEHYVDLALLDMRLEDDKDENDTSGLDIAKNVAATVPKVIISEYASFESARNALGMKKVDGLPVAVEFVKKSEGVEVLLKAIRKGLDLTPYFQRSLNEFTELLNNYFRDARVEAMRYSVVSLAASIFGILIILFAGIQGLQEKLAIAIITGVAGVIVEALGFLAFKRSDVANMRRDHYHADLLKIHQLDILLAACSTLNASKELRCREKVIDSAITYWFTQSNDEREVTATLSSSE